MPADRVTPSFSRVMPLLVQMVAHETAKLILSSSDGTLGKCQSPSRNRDGSGRPRADLPTVAPLGDGNANVQPRLSRDVRFQAIIADGSMTAVGAERRLVSSAPNGSFPPRPAICHCTRMTPTEKRCHSSERQRKAATATVSHPFRNKKR